MHSPWPVSNALLTVCEVYCTEPLPTGPSRQRTVCELLPASIVIGNLAQAIPQRILLLMQLLLVLLLFDLHGSAADVGGKKPCTCQLKEAGRSGRAAAFPC